MQTIVLILNVIAAVYLFVGVLWMARITNGYSHCQHTISELGERGAQHQQTVNLGLFLPVGGLLLAAAALAVGETPALAALGGCVAVGYLSAVLFPCDPGSPVFGGIRQGLHNAGGAVEYLGGGMVLHALAPSHGGVFALAGWLAWIGALLLTLLPPGLGRGFVQRIAELSLFASLVGVSAAVWSGGGAG